MSGRYALPRYMPVARWLSLGLIYALTGNAVWGFVRADRSLAPGERWATIAGLVIAWGVSTSLVLWEARRVVRCVEWDEERITLMPSFGRPVSVAWEDVVQVTVPVTDAGRVLDNARLVFALRGYPLYRLSLPKAAEAEALLAALAEKTDVVPPQPSRGQRVLLFVLVAIAVLAIVAAMLALVFARHRYP